MLRQHLCDLGRLHLQCPLQVVCVSHDRRDPLALPLLFDFDRVHTSTGGVMISCQVFLSGSSLSLFVYSPKDFSTNGFTLNGYDVRRSSVLLMDGDIMELPSSRSRKITYNVRLPNQLLISQLPEFKCTHLRVQCRERTSIFEPTPPTQPAQKVEFPACYAEPTSYPRNQKIGDFIVTSHSLGSGSFATVHLAMDHRSCRQVACKIIKAKNGKEVSSLMKEVDILTAVQHVWDFDVSIFLL